MHSGAPILAKKGTMHTEMGLYTHELVKKLEGGVPPVPPVPASMVISPFHMSFHSLLENCKISDQTLSRRIAE